MAILAASHVLRRQNLLSGIEFIEKGTYMKKTLICGMMIIGVAIVAPQNARPQGTVTYLSNLGQPSVGSGLVGSDSWVADEIRTGNNPGGYALDAIQLAMTSASGAPNGFTVELYSAGGFTAAFPGTMLATLSGPGDPETAGTYTYTASGLTLSPSTGYFIVLTAETTVASGAYAWSLANSSPPSIGGWNGGGYFNTSSDDGSGWHFTSSIPQFALTATAVPEPDTLGLLGLSGLLFLSWRRRQAKHSANGA